MIRILRAEFAIVPYSTGTLTKDTTQPLCLHKAGVHTPNLGTLCFVMQVITDICTQEPGLKMLLLINVLSFLLVKMTSVIHSFVGGKNVFQWKVAWSVSCPSGLSDSSPGKLHGLYYALLGYQILTLPIISELSGNRL